MLEGTVPMINLDYEFPKYYDGDYVSEGYLVEMLVVSIVGIEYVILIMNW